MSKKRSKYADARRPRALADDRQPWEQQPDESGRWHDRFALYRDAGSARSMQAIWRRTSGKTTQAPGSWLDAYYSWRWKDRARAWDRHCRKLLVQEHERAVLDMGRRAANSAVALQAVLMLPTQAAAQLVQHDRNAILAQLATMPPQDLIKLVQSSATAIGQAVRTEMLARGEATERIDATNAEQQERSDARRSRRAMRSLMSNPEARELARKLADLAVERDS